MSDKTGTRGFDPHALLENLADKRPRAIPKEIEPEGSDEEACPAFGFVRGTRDKALMLELRFRNGNREWYPYSLLGPCKYNPSVGILLKFAGDTVNLVLIRGSNLDAFVNQGTVNLTDRGIQRHRVLWVREMDEDELRRAPRNEPTIDGIEVGEFESHETQHEWLGAIAPVFLRSIE
ncbi:hypothetical protein VT84_06755 [Gemmata sp. SH-PL17]|uniref:hypothetical protein n=1 Tax=Gemmata sp. SH-PL17 TaxID=1630693 RepID=UPI00078E1848|nr:hypothetical protein [Gemmata sp. SH-PL17]AMV24078.1 hypothetical protein VT84_06755 [Gemmata sp. SH-PL17]